MDCAPCRLGGEVIIYKNGASLHSFKLDSSGSLNGWYTMIWCLELQIMLDGMNSELSSCGIVTGVPYFWLNQCQVADRLPPAAT